MKGIIFLVIWVAFWSLIITAFTGCATLPTPRARIVYDGQYGSYEYSAKSGFEARLKSLSPIPRLTITPEK